MRNLREWLVKEITLNDDDPDTDGLLAYNFDGMVENAFIESLRLKTVHFIEEQEWRVFLSNRPYKNCEWIYNKTAPLKASKSVDHTMNFLNDRVDFRYTNDDLVPFCPLKFEEFPSNPVVELWLGPKNHTRKSDAELFLWKYGYQNVDIYHSDITYR
jgi:hypothetical protein